MKKHTSKQISHALEQDNEKLFLYVLKKAAQKEKGERRYKVWQDEYHHKLSTKIKLSTEVGVYAPESSCGRDLWKRLNTGDTVAQKIIV